MDRRRFVSVVALAAFVIAGTVAVQRDGRGRLRPTLQRSAIAQADCVTRVGQFAWSCAGAIPGMVCTQIREDADPDTWQDNYFCATSDLGIRWNSAGPIPNGRCTQITEGAEPPEHTWQDNFLCVPPNSPLSFAWSSSGPITAMNCIRWNEPSDPHTWQDNYLCWGRSAIERR